MKIKGQAAVDVTATAARTTLPDYRVPYTLQNTDASNAVYYKCDPEANVADFAGTDAVLRGLDAGKIDAGDSVVIGPGIAWLDLVCATGLTSTLELEPGIHSSTESDMAAIKTAVEALNTMLGVSATAFQVTITSADASSATAVKAKTAAKRMFIHTVVLSSAVSLSLQLQDDTGTPVVLMEQVYLGANGGATVRFDPRTPLIVATNKDLDVLASGAGNISVSVFGYLAT